MLAITQVINKLTLVIIEEGSTNDNMISTVFNYQIWLYTLKLVNKLPWTLQITLIFGIA